MATIQQFGPMSVLIEWALSMGAFRRNRLPATKKVVAAALCNAGYSYREVAGMLGGLSYIAARDAYMAMLTSMPEEAKAFRREVAIDGTDVTLDGRRFHVWLARDVGTGEILTFHGSPTATAEDGARFLATVGSMCSNRPFLRLGAGANYPRGLVNLDLYFQLSPPPSFIGRLGRLIRGSPT